MNTGNLKKFRIQLEFLWYTNGKIESEYRNWVEIHYTFNKNKECIKKETKKSNNKYQIYVYIDLDWNKYDENMINRLYNLKK